MHDQNEVSEIHAEPFVERKLARAIHELCEDFGQLQEAVATWFKEDAEGWHEARARRDVLKWDIHPEAEADHANA